MRSKLGNSVSRSLSGSSLIGDGMLIRLRSSTLAILGLVAAVGLGMVGVVSQQGWPDGFSGPLPQAPSADFARNDPIGPPVGAIVPPPIGAGDVLSSRAVDPRRQASGAVAASEPAVGRQVAAAPPESAPVEPTVVPEPAGQEPAAGAPAPTPTSSPTQATAGVGSATGGGSPPVTAGSGRPPGVTDEDPRDRDGSGSPSWSDDDRGHGWDDDRGHGWGDDRRDDDGPNHWSDDDEWEDDDRGDGGYGHPHDDRHGHDDHDRGGWGRH